ncbi:hypothetical protein PQX77_013547 [Marasmius sp. AFHP31]|nr:hypothetical protein PQX77_013547 [Marasmius sp. AFHP31]
MYSLYSRYWPLLLPILISVVQRLAGAQFVTVFHTGTTFHTEVTIVDGTTLTGPRQTVPTTHSSTEPTSGLATSAPAGSTQTVTPSDSDRQVTSVEEPTSSSSQSVPPPIPSTSTSVIKTTISGSSSQIPQSTTPVNALASTNTVTITASPSPVTIPSDPSQPRIGLILGALFASLAFLSLAIFILLLLRRRRKRQRLATSEAGDNDSAAEASLSPELRELSSMTKPDEAGLASDEREIEPVPFTSPSEAQSVSGSDDPPPPYYHS